MFGRHAWSWHADDEPFDHWTARHPQAGPHHRHLHRAWWQHRGGVPWLHLHSAHHRRFWFAPDEERDFGHPFHGRPPFGDPFEDEGGRRRRRRGDLKYVLLELLAEQPRHGYELIKELEQRYAGFYRPSPGSVYPTLQLLEDEGSVTSEPVEGKRVYTITDAGRQVLAERQRNSQAPSDAGRDGRRGGPGPELKALRRSAMALGSSVMEAARHGTPEQRRAVAEQLDATRRAIYSILAGDESDRVI